MTHLPAILLLAAISTAQAATVTCMPKPVGSGTAALFKSNTRGDFVAWYCPGEAMPSMVVCLKSTCGLVGSKRALAAIASKPTLASLNEALKPYTRDPLRDPDLVKVWAPHADEIRKLAD